MKGIKKDFCKYMTSHREMKENMEKAEVLDVFFTLDFIVGFVIWSPRP